MGIPRKHLHDFISTLKSEIEFSQFGLSSLLVPVSFQVYEEWIEKGYHGEMDYLRRHLPAKKDVKSVYPFAESAIVFAFPYFPWPTEGPDHATNLRTALYSKGKDYHQWIIEKLNTVILNLQRTYTDHQFLAATDSKPVLERDLAYRAGLGWVGKNTCLIDRKTGSLFFIAEIFCSFKIIEDVPNPYSHDFCGTCQKCIQICPTQAIEAERVLNANKCISYLTIEAKTVPPVEIRKKMGDWFFGCDLCQTVCPWNQKIFGGSLSTENLQTQNDQQNIAMESELKDILNFSSKKIEQKYQYSPLARARGFGLKRNALIVIANRKIISLKSEIEEFISTNQNNDLVDLAKWTLKELS